MSESDAEFIPSFVYTGRKRISNLAMLLHNRELGRKNSNVIRIKAQLPFSDLQISIQRDKSLIILNKRTFCGRYSGYLGITHNSHFLVSMATRPEKISNIFFFSFTPEEAKLNRIIVADIPNGYLYLVKVYVPPLGTNYTAVYLHDIAEHNSLTNKENNLPVHIHISPSKYLLQINISNLIVVIPRIVTTINKKATKYYVATHEDGIILNTGVAMVNYMFIDINKIREDQLVRKIWKITRKPFRSFMTKSERCYFPLDLGESLSISGCADCSAKDFQFQYKLVKFHEDPPEGEEVLPLVFVRDYFAIDDWLSEAIQNYLQKSPIFKDSTLRALQDYEADVSDIEKSTTTIQAFALCELEMCAKSDTSVNEFHLFHLIFQWDLFGCRLTFVSEPIHLGKIEPRYVFANRWWPVRSTGTVPTKEIHQYLSNHHILKGNRICQQLTAYNGSLELTFDPAHFYSILRPDAVDF